MSNQIDPEETTQERAARVIDNASRHWKERNLKFETTLRNNVRDLSPYKRQVLAAWVKRMTEGIVLEIVLARAFRKASRSPDDRDRHAHR